MDISLLLASRSLPVRFKDGTKGFAISEYTDMDSACFPKNFTICSDDVIVKHIAKIHADALAHASLFALDNEKSCRNIKSWNFNNMNSFIWIMLGFALFASPAFYTTTTLFFVGAVTLANSLFKLTILLATWRIPLRPPRKNCPPEKQRARFDYPIMSVLVPLNREATMLPHLIKRLARLKYPRHRLEILFIIEEDDTETDRAFDQQKLPHYMRLIKVPKGKICTKPRALNFTMPLTRGAIIGVYDSEDAPETDQLLKAAHTFAKMPDNVACLQAKLAFYNPQTNWIARCFALEYSAWFTTMLPGLCALNLPIPLGGTSGFIRRKALLDAGGWDAFNVTEDADLGMRLARSGHKTRLLNSTTYEEANCYIWPWIKQRSRWLKGFMMTYAVQIRTPAKCFLEHGLSGFIAIHMIFIGCILSALFIPIHLNFWLASFNFSYWQELPHFTSQHMKILMYISILSEGVLLSLTVIGANRAGIPRLILWVPMLTLYFSMSFIAVFKAITEFIFMPFYWDKTNHGASLRKAHKSTKESKEKLNGLDIMRG